MLAATFAVLFAITACSGLTETIESGKRTVENVEESSSQVLQLLTDLRVAIVCTGTLAFWKALGLAGRTGYRRIKNGVLAKKLMSDGAAVIDADGKLQG